MCIRDSPHLAVQNLTSNNEFQFNLPTPKIVPDESEQIEKIKKIKHSFFVELSGERGLINRTNNFNFVSPEQIERLNQNEETLTSRALLSTNLSIGYQHQSRWFLQSGVEYQRVVEFFKLDDTLVNTRRNVWNERAHYFLDQNADTLFFADSSVVGTLEIRKVRHNNYHSFYTIPLEVGYRHKIGKTNVFGTVGISYAFAHNFKGRVSRLVEIRREVVDNPSFMFKNRFGFRAGFGAEYPLSKRTQAFMTMNYRRSPTLLFSEVDEQFYQSVSLGVGVRQSLF